MEFLLAQGRQEDATEWMQKTRTITALLGERSPLAAYVERRLGQAAASSASAGSGTSHR
jgi:hypothetical protein